MRWLARRPSANAGSPQADGELLAAAERFVALFHDENPGAGAFGDRMRQAVSPARLAPHPGRREWGRRGRKGAYWY